MSLDRIEKLLKAHEAHTERTNRELLLELRKMQEEVDYLRKLNNFEALKRDAVFNNPDQTTSGARLTKRKGWYTSGRAKDHDSHYMPDTIAQAQLIESRMFGKYRRADSLSWLPGMGYRFVYANDGVHLCADQGLEPWAEYVATDMDGIVHQYAATPEWCVDDRMWNNTRGGWKKIPEYSARFYRKNVSASESLMRVWRDV